MSPYRNLDGLSLSAARPIEVLAAVHNSARRSILVATSSEARERNASYRDQVGVQLNYMLKGAGFPIDACVVICGHVFRVAESDDEPAIFYGIDVLEADHDLPSVASEWAFQHGEMVDFNDR